MFYSVHVLNSHEKMAGTVVDPKGKEETKRRKTFVHAKRHADVEVLNGGGGGGWVLLLNALS